MRRISNITGGVKFLASEAEFFDTSSAEFQRVLTPDTTFREKVAVQRFEDIVCKIQPLYKSLGKSKKENRAITTTDGVAIAQARNRFYKRFHRAHHWSLARKLLFAQPDAIMTQRFLAFMEIGRNETGYIEDRLGEIDKPPKLTQSKQSRLDRDQRRVEELLKGGTRTKEPLPVVTGPMPRWGVERYKNSNEWESISKGKRINIRHQ